MISVYYKDAVARRTYIDASGSFVSTPDTQGDIVMHKAEAVFSRCMLYEHILKNVSKLMCHHFIKFCQKINVEYSKYRDFSWLIIICMSSFHYGERVKIGCFSPHS